MSGRGCSEGARPPKPRGRPAWISPLTLVVVGVALLMVGAPFFGGLPFAPAHAAAPLLRNSGTGPSFAAAHPIAAGATSGHPVPGGISPLVSSGRGTFFTTAQLPYGPTPACWYITSCGNSSYDPSIISTSTGLVASAYAVFTNATPCANVTPYATVEIGVSTSSNAGTSWTTPSILGNTNCSVANQYVDSWEPSLAALANGTLVLAFIEFNITFGQYPWDSEFGAFNCLGCSYNIPNAALAFTESYNGGTSWTTPQILNASANPGLNASAFTPLRPWVAASGDTVYVTWMNYTTAPGYDTATGSAQVHLLVSTDGGATWGSMINLPNQVPVPTENLGINPSLLVSPTGTLYVTYTTNFSFQYSWPSGCSTTCVYDIQTVNVVVGTSTNNGTSFSFATVADSIPDFDYDHSFIYQLAGQMFDPSPQLAWNPVDGDLYDIWASGGNVPVCYSYGCYTMFGENVAITTSADGGATWTTPHNVSSGFQGPEGLNAFQPAIAVNNTGAVIVTAEFLNYSQNERQYEGYTTSTDDGATFAPLIIAGNNTTEYPESPFGEYSTMVNANGTILFAYSLQNSTCMYCSFPYGGGSINAVVGQLYAGTGVTLTFVEAGLSGGTNWGINVEGNLRNTSAPGTLSVSGVPPSYPISYLTAPVASGYGVRFFSTSYPLSPGNFSTSSTVYENFTEQVEVNVSTIPYYPSCLPSFCPYPAWNQTFEMDLNYNITPGPQISWVPLNSTFTEVITPVLYGVPGCSFCTVDYTDLSFISWTGNGLGSINSSAMNISFVARGPMNETANFYIDGTCSFTPATSPKPTCNLLNQTLTFAETGLPANVPWSVTVESSVMGLNATVNSTAPLLAVTSNATLGLVTYQVWSIPDGSTGLYWVGTGSPGSPVVLPTNRVVDVTFTLEHPANANFGVRFIATGLPNETAWSLGIGSTSYGVQTPTANYTLAGGTYSLNASPIYFQNGSGYYVSSFLIVPFTENATNQTYSTLPASVSFVGPALVYVQFSPQYLVDVSASVGGSSGPASTWVHSAHSIALTESANSGYYFVGWTGTGAGSYTGTSASPTITPGTPVTELATFSVMPASRWTVSVTVTGITSGASISFGLGGLNYTIGATGTVPNLLTGNYAITLPYSYANSSELTRFVPTGWSSSYTNPTSSSILVNANGTLTLVFETQFLASLTATPGGSIAPLPGAYWWTAGSSNMLTASANPGYSFAQWSGTQSSTQTTLVVTATAPVNLTAQFIVKPPVAPATFSLTVKETGLPTGATWSVSVGTTGASGSTPTLVIPGLNGSYPVTVPNAYIGTGTRYVLTGTIPTTPVTSNAQLNVTFAGQYLVTVSGGTGGTVSPGSAWIPAGTTITLGATANNSYTFAGWVGTGTGSYTGSAANGQVTANAPINETATFSPVYSASSTGSSTDGLYLAIGLLVALLAVGVIVGMLLGRRRPPAASSNPTPEETPTSEASPTDGSETTYGGSSGGDT